MAEQGKKSSGPYLAAAFFCESVIEDKHDNALSAIRIIDQVNLVLSSNAPSDFPSEQTRLPVPISGILSFKTGGAPGEHIVRVEMVSPSGKRSLAHKQTLVCSKEEHGGANLRYTATVMVMKGGLFWFDLFLDDELVTRMPLKIAIQRESLPQSPPSDS
jgi:hypothetical protein